MYEREIRYWCHDRPVVSEPVSAPLLMRSSSSSSAPILRGTRHCDIDFFIVYSCCGFLAVRLLESTCESSRPHYLLATRF